MLAFALAEMVGVAIGATWTVLPTYASELALLAATDYRHDGFRKSAKARSCSCKGRQERSRRPSSRRDGRIDGGGLGP